MEKFQDVTCFALEDAKLKKGKGPNGMKTSIPTILSRKKVEFLGQL